MSQPQYIQIVTTTSSAEEAKKIGETIVTAQLAACVQVEGPITSIYRWEGKVTQSLEWRCVMKTRSDIYEQAEEAILQIHSYETPQVLALPILKGSTGYLNWVADETI